MMCHLYFSRYKLFDNKYVHIIKQNVLHLNTDFFLIIKGCRPRNFGTVCNWTLINELTLSNILKLIS